MVQARCVLLWLLCSLLCAGQGRSPSDAATLLAFKTEKERTQWLDQNPARCDAACIDELLAAASSANVTAKWSKGLEASLIAIDVARRSTDLDRLALALRSAGESYYLLGRLKEAESVAGESIALLEKQGPELELARSVNTLGKVFYGQGRMPDAVASNERSLAIRLKHSDTAGIAQSNNNLGAAWKAQGEYGRAVEYLNQSLEAFESLGDRRSMTVVLRNMCISTGYQAAYGQALEYCDRSLKTAMALGDETQISACFDALGNIHSFMGDWGRALQNFQRALALRQKISFLSGIAETLNNIGLIYLSQGNARQAVSFLTRSQQVNRKLEDESLLAETDTNLGIAWMQEGNYVQALTALRRGLERSESQGYKSVAAVAFNTIGRVYQRQRRLPDAIAAFQKALRLHEEMGTEAGLADSLADLAAAALDAKNPAGALQYAERAMKAASAIGYSERHWLALTVAGRSHLALGRKDEARRAFDDAITLIEKSREFVAGGASDRSRFLADKIAPYHERIALAIADGRPVDALHYAERSRARVLLDILQGGRTQPEKALTAAEHRREEALRASLASLNTQLVEYRRSEGTGAGQMTTLKQRLDAKRLEYEAFLTATYAAHPELKVQRGESGVSSPEEVRSLLEGERAALIEYVVTPRRTWLFVLAPGSPARVFPIAITSKALAARVRQFREQLESRDLLYSENARKLYDLLLGPAAALLQGVDRVLVSPDGALWEVPFQALRSSDGRFLIESKRVAYVPSLTVLREFSRLRQRDRAKQSMTLLAAGNPKVDKWPPLPEAEVQVAQLAKLYGANSSRTYVGAEAREDRVKAEAGRSDVLHLATHGMLNDDSPLYSYLALASGGSEDGLLEAWELMQLDLRAELVVLSACDSGRGRVSPGEGLIGMSWALFLAGTPSTLTSQWKVSAASTTELMVRFHRHWLEGRSKGSAWTKADALRTAALDMLSNLRYRHPYYWSGFVLIGDTR